jgi:putative tryptophan/tyrosine transport system substrate-binding protein
MSFTRRGLLHGLTGVAALGSLSACGTLWTSSSKSRLHRVGYLFGDTESADLASEFRQGLRELGYAVGSDVVIEWRYAEGKYDRLVDMANELVDLPVDVLVPMASPAAQAARQATTSVPIVFVNVNDPVGTGLVATLAHPGGNITGVSTLSGAISGRRLQVLKETVPDLSRVGILWNAANSGMALAFSSTQEAASVLGLRVQSLGVRTADAVADALGARPATGYL